MTHTADNTDRQENAAMTDLPMWAVELVAGLAQYDATHPMLYAQHAGNPGNVPTDCPCHLLCAVPNDVIAYARGFAAGRDSVSSVGGTTEEQP